MATSIELRGSCCQPPLPHIIFACPSVPAIRQIVSSVYLLHIITFSLVVLLLKRGAKLGPVDEDGKDALAIALDKENGDIVTLLRVAQLKADQRQDDKQSQVCKELCHDDYKCSVCACRLYFCS